jgi:molybdopterin-guanine dinucleotide biosynthesis protein A
MGTEKSLLMLRGKPMLTHIVERIAAQVNCVIINANGDAARYAEFGLEVVADRRSDVGTPLAGIHAGLAMAIDRGFDAVLTVPSDCPFLPRDLVARLCKANTPAAIAASGGQQHYLTGLWRAGLLKKLAYEIDHRGLFRVRDWAIACAAVPVLWPDHPHDPFFNVNTPEDLAEAARIAAESSP